MPCCISFMTKENRDNIHPSPMANIISNIQKTGTKIIACQLILSKTKPSIKVISKPDNPGTCATRAERNGINSAGNTVFNNRFLLAVRELEQAVMVAENVSKGTRPENTRSTYSHTDNPVTRTLKTTV